VLSLRKLRQSVLRDMAWLLNSVNLEAVEDLEPYPFVAKSVLNFGMPDLSGKTASGIDAETVERLLLEAVWDFEPRILKNSVRIRIRLNEDQMNRNAMVFDIEGDLWAQPVPIRMFLKSEVDLETGTVRIGEVGGVGSL
jgi:type VI secretion system protein ImpF